MRTAAYARYSSDQQRDASLDDQLRNCRQHCERQGWPMPEEYTDAATSGARNDRAGYLRLLADVAKFDIVIVDDLSRLSRDSAEVTMAVRRMKFAGTRLICVSDNIDTNHGSSKMNVSLRGLMSEMYLEDLACKTHRGLTGRALAGASAGGLPYGYRVTEVGQRSIDAEQAAIVRRIYTEYVAGSSPRTIADGLNRDKVAPARAKTWAMSAIYGDMKRGIGILANPIYCGRQVWNRSQWIKHPETGRRVRKNRPPAEWITTEQPELAIIDQVLYEAAQTRIRQAKPQRPDAMKGSGPGRPPSNLLSGILRCGECGGPMVIVDRYRYGCSTHKDRGETACPSRVRVPRAAADQALLAGVRETLLSDAAFQRMQRVVTAELKRAVPDLDSARRKITDAERVQSNIMAALRMGIITASTKSEAMAAEAAVNTARAELVVMQSFQPSQIMPRMRERWREAVAKLADYARNIPAARGALRELLGDRIVVRNENGELFAEIAGSDVTLNMVAGAGFEPATFGL